MKTTKKVVDPAKERTVTDETFCDLCKEKIPPVRAYDIREVSLDFEEGTNYPGDYNTTTISFDICPSCFTNKIVPWMALQGATPSKESTDW